MDIAKFMDKKEDMPCIRTCNITSASLIVRAQKSLKPTLQMNTQVPVHGLGGYKNKGKMHT